ncbi:sulfonate ABC transporter, solute-binding protein [Arthrobacter crystallopoietes BAB-32]|uniref:Sulfonate ABC transporter, solute-binding protein n=1 Tax=Arthrobacter crystallopoietes BAB-32 TaxID=1246476 RepID=N1V116_9MICC|nr:ABC transporter substrate-binding protein [Arthrobacter crystallopoietes]EMY35030.1 sulfonate ABC transporter, solute-binding protein [Arthrobacter crystallopoietes BAB-32]
MGKKNLTVALATVAVLALSACGGSDAGSSEAEAAGGTGTLKVGTIGIGSDAAIKMAIDKGYFKDEGLNVETSVVANPPAGVAAAQSGQLDLTYSPSIPMLNAMSQNVPLKIVAAADGYAPKDQQPEDLAQVDDTGLFVPKGSSITSPKDLEGKSVSVPARKAQMEVTVAKAVKDAGGDPAKINWMVLDPASALQSLDSKRVDAAALVAPFTSQAESKGHGRLASPGVEFFQEGAVGLWVAGAKTVEEKKDQMAGFARAINKANDYANKNLEEAQKAGAQLTGVPLETLQKGAETYWPTEVKLEEIHRVNKQLAELGFLAKEVPLDQDLIFNGQ